MVQQFCNVFYFSNLPVSYTGSLSSKQFFFFAFVNYCHGGYIGFPNGCLQAENYKTHMIESRFIRDGAF